MTRGPDYAHYRDQHLVPAADGILRFLGTSFETLTTAQLFMMRPATAGAAAVTSQALLGTLVSRPQRT